MDKQPKRPTFYSIAIPFFLLPGIFGDAANLISSLGLMESYAEKIEQVIENADKLEFIGYRTITAYNPVEGQTDKDPCIGALPSINLCTTEQKIVAVRESHDPKEDIPLGSKLIIDGEEYLVADRLAKKNAGLGIVDVLFNVHNTPPHIESMSDAIAEAKNFGRKEEVRVYRIVEVE